ncbi:MAG: phospholipase D-like domain-containing protein [Thermomicrobiales bacterium]
MSSMDNGQPLAPGENEVAVRFLAQGEQTGAEVADWLVAFIAGAQQTLDLALYDCRLSQPLWDKFAAALHERAGAGVAIRIVYDADKPEPPALADGMDPAEAGTGAFIQSLQLPFRRIGGLKLMHHKYMVRDALGPEPCIWTGSTNFTDDAWTLQENNIVQLASAEAAAAYAHDFADLWRLGHNDGTGEFDPAPLALRYADAPLTAQVYFSPGRGEEIDDAVAACVAGAQRRVRICSMLLNSGALLNALSELLRAGQTLVDGVYDQTQMESVLEQWQTVPHNVWKIGAVRDIVEQTKLVGKISTPYHPDTPHDFMHAKILVVDDTVITGSYNFSRSAEMNAENILFLKSAALAERYSAYIDHVKAALSQRQATQPAAMPGNLP